MLVPHFIKNILQKLEGVNENYTLSNSLIRNTLSEVFRRSSMWKFIIDKKVFQKILEIFLLI